jgi:folate-binding protein YgfZ
LNPAGGIESDAWVVECPSSRFPSLALVVPSSRFDRVRALLEKYLVNEDLTIALDDAVRIVAVLGPARHAIVTYAPTTMLAYSSTRLGLTNVELWIPAKEIDDVFAQLSTAARTLGGGGIDEPRWSSARVVLGIPKAGVDFDENFSPDEAGLGHRAVSLTKGCYLGQEVVARQHRRGTVPRRLVQFELHSSEKRYRDPAVCDYSGAEVGRVTSFGPFVEEGTSRLALGHVKSSFAQAGNHLSLGATTARVRRILGHPESTTLKGVE